MAQAIATYPSLDGRTVLVTGGGSGIGAAVTTRFAEQGARVAFLDIADGPSQALAETLSGAGHDVLYVRCDLRDIAALRAAVARVREAYGPVTVLINNAAHDERHATPDVTPEMFDERIAVNLRHQFFAAQAVLPDMQAAGGGAIVNFGSVSWMIGQGGMPVYTAAKSAVIGLTRSLARDYGAFNIRVNAIAPGWIMTERQKEKWLTPDGEAELMRRQCLKRHLLPTRSPAPPCSSLPTRRPPAPTSITSSTAAGFETRPGAARADPARSGPPRPILPTPHRVRPAP